MGLEGEQCEHGSSRRAELRGAAVRAIKANRQVKLALCH